MSLERGMPLMSDTVKRTKSNSAAAPSSQSPSSISDALTSPRTLLSRDDDGLARKFTSRWQVVCAAASNITGRCWSGCFFTDLRLCVNLLQLSQDSGSFISHNNNGAMHTFRSFPFVSFLPLLSFSNLLSSYFLSLRGLSLMPSRRRFLCISRLRLA